MKILFFRMCLSLLAGLIIASISQWFMEKRVKAEINNTPVELNSPVTLNNSSISK